MRRFRKETARLSGSRVIVRCALLAMLAVIGLPVALNAQGPKELPELRVKSTVYRTVRVISRNPTSITIRHSSGIVQVPLKDLSPELQTEFGFVPEDAEAFEERLQIQAEAAAERQARELAGRSVGIKKPEIGRLDRIAQAFALDPEIGGVDMRPRFREMELFVKNQGRRPSCSVFAVVSALELQNSEITGRPEKLSEEYLIWATLQMVGAREPVVLDEEGAGVISDAGFSILEVFQALGKFGIPLQDSLPNNFGTGADVLDMPAELIAEARAKMTVSAFAVPGRDAAEMSRNMIHVLNNGVPVVLAIKWPHTKAAMGGLLSGQDPIPGYAHAVTVVGYVCESGRLEDLRFIFKNSWGTRWGAYGYGFADMNYMLRNMLGAAFLDVRKPGEAGG